MRVFVTGGTGLLGNTVIRQLCEQGDQVLALVRREPEPEVFESLDVELVHAELVQETRPTAEEDRDTQDDHCKMQGDDSIEPALDPIDDAIEHCDMVVHSAATIQLGWTGMEESLRVNRDGTQRIAESCLRHGKKMVLVGTVDTLALGSPQVTADETTPLAHAGGQVECAYVKSKRAAVQVVNELVAQGLQAVIVHPGFMLGPWDWKPSSGRMIWEIAKSWKAISPPGGCSVCDSRDVAAAVINALKTEIPSGRQFILAGHNWSYHKLWSEMAKRVEMRTPLRSAGPGLLFLAGGIGDLVAKIWGKEGDLNSASVKMSSQFHWYDSKRAQTELKYQIRDIQQTLDDATEWVKDRFILPGKRSGG